MKFLNENPRWSGGFLLSAFRNETQAGDPAMATTTTVNLFVFAGIRGKLGKAGRWRGKSDYEEYLAVVVLIIDATASSRSQSC